MGKTSLYIVEYIQKQARNQDTVCDVQLNKLTDCTVKSICRFKTIPSYLVFVWQGFGRQEAAGITSVRKKPGTDLFPTF